MRASDTRLRGRSLGCNGYIVKLGTRERFVGLAAVSAAVILCVLLVDRPLALWLDARCHGTTAFAIGAFVLRPLDGLLIAGALLLGVAVVWRRAHGAPRWANRFAVGGTGAALALLAALALKVAIGRSQVYPAFLQNHAYGFRLFAGSRDLMAFPSATMAGVGGFVSGVGTDRPYQRVAAAALLVMLASALLVTSSHWLSDIIGGTYLGVVSGGAARVLRRREG